MGVPQVALVLGHCTAGGAYIPALSEYSVIVRGTGAIFLGGPPLVKAATGEDVTVEELGGADMHTQHLRHGRLSGSQRAAGDRDRARDRRPVPARREKAAIERSDPEPPHYDPQELYGIIPRDIKVQFDMREVIARIVDGSRFHEYQPAYGTTLVCGFAHIWGYKVGILANNGVLFNDSVAEGRALHRAVQPEPHADDVPAEHHRLHGRPRVRAARHHQGRRQDDHGGGGLRGAEVHRDVQRLVRRRQLRHVAAAPSIRASCSPGRSTRSR